MLTRGREKSSKKKPFRPFIPFDPFRPKPKPKPRPIKVETETKVDVKNKVEVENKIENKVFINVLIEKAKSPQGLLIAFGVFIFLVLLISAMKTYL